MREILIGIAGGIIIGATGSGTGALVTPLLILAGYRPAIAIATGVGSLFVSKLAGTVTHRRLGHWPGRAAWFLVAGGALGVVILSMLSLPSVGDDTLKRAVGVTLLATTASLTWASRRTAETRESDVANPSTQPRALLLFGSGLAIAPVVALTSAGSGTLLVALLLLATSWRVPSLAAASNIFGTSVAALSLALQWKLATFDLRLFALVAAGLVPGVIVGALLSRFISRQWLVWTVYMLTIGLGTVMLA